MIIESGVIIFFGMLLLGIKLPRRISLKLLGYPLALDLGVSVLAYAMHYGTFSGIQGQWVAEQLQRNASWQLNSKQQHSEEDDRARLNDH